MKAEDMRPGDLLEPPSGDRYKHFIDRVLPDGLWLDLVYVHSTERMGEVTTTYSKLAGHGCVVPFKPCSWWRGWGSHKRIAVLPRLIGERSVSITVSM